MTKKIIQAVRLAAVALCVAICSVGGVHAKQSLSIRVYNPGANSIFPVSSVLVTGRRDAILIDAQFQANDARHLVHMITATHRHLKVIYISHSDPDYYFGLDVLHRAFPDAQILATPQTVAAIRVLKDRKLRYWGPILGKNAPKTLIVPAALNKDHLMLEGHRLMIEGLRGPTPARSYVYIPSLRTVAGGAVVFSGTHVWVADTQTTQARADWIATLDAIAALHPVQVIPGHYLGARPDGLGAVVFTKQYLQRFDQALVNAPNAQALIDAVKTAYPGLPEADWLALGAKVVKGDMAWPQ